MWPDTAKSKWTPSWFSGFSVCTKSLILINVDERKRQEIISAGILFTSACFLLDTSAVCTNKPYKGERTRPWKERGTLKSWMLFLIWPDVRAHRKNACRRLDWALKGGFRCFSTPLALSCLTFHKIDLVVKVTRWASRSSAMRRLLNEINPVFLH